MEQGKLKESDFYYYFKFKKQDHNFENLWRMKASARVAVKEWLQAMPCNKESSEKIANACSELIENCIKYSLSETFSSVEIYVIEDSIYVETRNLAGEEQQKEVEDFMAMLKKEKDLQELYLTRLNDSLQSGISQIGLIKILMETSGNLTLIKSEHNVHLQLVINLV